MSHLPGSEQKRALTAQLARQASRLKKLVAALLVFLLLALVGVGLGWFGLVRARSQQRRAEEETTRARVAQRAAKQADTIVEANRATRAEARPGDGCNGAESRRSCPRGGRGRVPLSALP